VAACCDRDECWYDADGKTFACNGTDCVSAARNVVDYCSESEEEEESGCSISVQRSPSSLGLLASLGAALTLAIRRRRRLIP
jgi:hypothetical protein